MNKFANGEKQKGTRESCGLGRVSWGAGAGAAAAAGSGMCPGFVLRLVLSCSLSLSTGRAIQLIREPAQNEKYTVTEAFSGLLLPQTSYVV